MQAPPERKVGEDGLPLRRRIRYIALATAIPKTCWTL